MTSGAARRPLRLWVPVQTLHGCVGKFSKSLNPMPTRYLGCPFAVLPQGRGGRPELLRFDGDGVSPAVPFDNYTTLSHVLDEATTGTTRVPGAAGVHGNDESIQRAGRQRAAVCHDAPRRRLQERRATLRGRAANARVQLRMAADGDAADAQVPRRRPPPRRQRRRLLVGV